MFVSITFHPNRGEWRSLFATEAEAAADAARFLALFADEPVAVAARVEVATYDDAAEYVDTAHEREGEARAEYGSGAVSMGYAASEVMAHYDGYRASEDALYAAATRFLSALRPAPTPITAPVATDDIPF